MNIKTNDVYDRQANDIRYTAFNTNRNNNIRIYLFHRKEITEVIKEISKNRKEVQDLIRELSQGDLE